MFLIQFGALFCKNFHIFCDAITLPGIYHVILSLMPLYLSVWGRLPHGNNYPCVGLPNNTRCSVTDHQHPLSVSQLFSRQYWRWRILCFHQSNSWTQFSRLCSCCAAWTWCLRPTASQMLGAQTLQNGRGCWPMWPRAVLPRKSPVRILSIKAYCENTFHAGVMIIFTAHKVNIISRKINFSY